MAETHDERDERDLADELAARLDAGSVTPLDGDDPAIESLISTYGRLQAAAGEPDPAFGERLRRVLLNDTGKGSRKGGMYAWPLLSTLLASIGERRGWAATALHLAVLLLVAAGFAGLWWYNSLPQRIDGQQTIVVGSTRLAPDSEASVRVVVQDSGQGKPVPGARVQVSLKPAKGRAKLLYQGRTDETGSLPVRFHVPADAPSDARLVVETRSALGRDRVERQVTVQREYRLLFTSDKPLYQPGQTIHMRALALGTLDLSPARGAAIDFLVQDARGNKVFRKSVAASDFGVAAADFTLADMVNQGSYTLSASIGDTGYAEKTVEVRPYVLPKFGVSVSTEHSFYLPRQRVNGVVQADYFFGKAVADAQVQVVGSVQEVERTVTLDLRGQTDERGAYQFSFDLPQYFAGSGLESGQAQFALEVTVIDQTDHAEQTSQVLPIAAQPLVIEAVAESGRIKPGVENVVYILTSYPDGRPAPATLEVRADDSAPATLNSGEYGLAEFAFTPQRGRGSYSLYVNAQDEAGLWASRMVQLEADGSADSVLLRADRAAYVVGETMHLVALTPVESGSVYLDIVKAGQTLSTRSARVEEGKAEFLVDVGPDLYGTLELHAYKVLPGGTVVRDTRLVVVDAPNEIEIHVAADKETYLPGETATIDLQTTGAEEAGVQTALGIAVVDESVFALQRQDPGFAKLYFMLEQELLEPFYQVKGFELPASLPPDEGQIRATQDDAAKAAWAGAPVAAERPTNSRSTKIEAVQRERLEGIQLVVRAAVWGLGIVPLAALVLVLVLLWRAGVVGRSVRGLIMTIAFMLVAASVARWLGPSVGRWRYIQEEVGVLLTAALGLGIAIFCGYAWMARDRAARSLIVLTLAWGGFLALLALAWRQGYLPRGMPLFIVPLGYLCIPLAYLLFGQGRWGQVPRTGERARRWGGALATGLGVLCVLYVVPVINLPDLLFPSPSPSMLMQQGAPTQEMRGLYGLDQPA